MNNYPNVSDKEDVTAELASILQRVRKGVISVDVAVKEIGAILPLNKLGPAVKEKVRVVVTGLIGVASDDEFEEGLQAIADAISETSKPLPTPLPTPSLYVRP